MIFLLFVLTLVTLSYVYLKWNYSYWKHKKVPGPEPTFFIGNIGPTLNFSKNQGVMMADWYKQYPNEPYIGYYKFMKPCIVCRDLDLVKSVLIKDFNKFRANDAKLSKKYDPLLAAHPSFCVDEEWKKGRKQVMPIFSSGKLKVIADIMNGVGFEMVEYIKKHPSDKEFDAKKLSSLFTTQNMVKSTFSFDPGCFELEQESEFVKVGQKVFEPTSFLVGLKFLALPYLPDWSLDIIPIPLTPKEVDKMFRKLVSENKKSRSEDNQSNDLFHMLLQLQEKNNSDDTALAGYTLALYVESTETSSVTMSYALYALAKHPHCQDKVFNEIVETMTRYGNKLTGEAIQDLKYLENVLLESTRINPAALTLSKTCTEKYELPINSHQSKPVTIYPGTILNIPIQEIQMDPNNYPNPNEFIPDRFSDEQQRSHHKALFLTFGEGPRMCPGMRYAIAQVKIGLAHIVKNFHINLSPNQKPIVINPLSFLTYPVDGILIQLQPR